jgi:transposase
MSNTLRVRDGVADPVTANHPYTVRLAVFRRTAATLMRWRQGAPNHWRHPLTNALVEGKHNRVKALKRSGYGSRDRRSFLLVILNPVRTD